MSIQDRAQHQISQLDKELTKWPALANFEKQTSVPKVYLVLGIGALYFFFIFFNLGGQLLVNFAGFVIPGYYSLQALFSASKTDDTQWLTYWVVFAFLTVIESLVSVVYWFPFYYTFKFFFVLWLALPQFGGSQVLFHNFIAPVFSRYFNHTAGGFAQNLKNQADEVSGKRL